MIRRPCLPFALAVSLAALTWSACKKPTDKAPGSVVPSVVAAYTSGTVSRESVVRVQFTEAMVDAAQVGNAIDKSPFSLSPKADGTALWVDRLTLELRPQKPFEAGRLYAVEVALDKIVPATSTDKELKFSFTVMRQSVGVRRDGFEAVSGGAIGEQRYRGAVITADVADASEVEKVLTAKLDGKALNISWSHEPDRKTHPFIIANVVRQDSEKALTLSWDGSAISAAEKGEEVAKLPGLSTFAVEQVRVMQGAEQYVEVRFSDALDPKQNLSGLVLVGSEHPRLTVDGSVLRVYTRVRAGAGAELTIEPGVKNAAGHTLAGRYTESLSFAPLTPAVRFASKGVLVPTTAGLALPIETANIKAIVVEAVRVPEQNMPQFLQVNGLDGSNEMRRVGRTVWRQTVDLGVGTEQRNSWTRIGLDVKPLISQNPGGLYRIRLSFKRQHIIYDCPTPAPDELPDDGRTHDDDFDKEERSASYWDSAEEGGGVYYSWEERKNPCSPAFYRESYNPELAVTRNVLVTDVGLIAKVGTDGSLFVTSTDLKTAGPLSGANIEVLDFQQQKLGSATTGSDGSARITVDHRPFVIVAKSGSQRGYLKLDEGSALALSHFDVSGAAVTKGIKGKIYGERGVWRPGDDIFLTFTLYDPDHHIPADHPVRFELVDPRGSIAETITRRSSVNGFYAFHTKTAPDAATGNYTARVRVGGATFEETLKVEMVRPNRLKITFDPHAEVLKSGEKIKAKLSSVWLHGAIARNLKADVSVTLERAPTRFKTFPEFVFDDPLRKFDAQSSQLFDGNLDEEGNAEVEGELSAQGQAPGMLTATFSNRVFESSGVYSSDTMSVPFSPYQRYIGIKPPKGDAARGMLLTDMKHQVPVVALTAEGRPAPGEVTVECKLYKVAWRWWWEKGEDSSLADYVESRGHQAIASGVVKLKNGEGTWEFEVKYPEWGRYVMVARDLQGGHRTGKVVFIDWPGWAGRSQKDNPGGAAVLAFAADKAEYNVGDTVTLTVPTAQAGRGLVSIESGSKVLKADWIEAKGGETTHKFQVTPEMAPNVYVNITLVQPHMQAKNDHPIRMYGVIPLKVVDPDTKLQPQLEAPDVFIPETQGQVIVKEAKGRPMTYTLAVVDEGLLGLTRFQTPQLWDTFYRREALGVRTWDVYEMVAGAYGGSLERMLAIGGGDEGPAAEGGKKANRFPPMVRFMGPFALAAGANGTHKIDIPRYIGAVRVMVVAGSGRAFGSVDKSVFVRKPLLLLATLPRVLGPEEEVDLPITVFALEEKVKTAKVTVLTSGPVELSKPSSRDLKFRGPGDETVTFRLIAKAETGVAKIDVVVEGAGEKAQQTIEIDVRMPGVRVTDVVAGVVEPGKSWSDKLTLPGYAGTNTAVLEVSRVPPLDLGRRLDYLVQYPHGCVEQTTSSVFPQLYLSSLLELGPERKVQIESNVKAGIDRLRLFQTPSGGFSYWPGGDQPDDWASNYAGHFLAEAKKAGYLVQDTLLDPWKRYQKNRANSQTASGPMDARTHGDLDQAYRLYGLALAGAAELGAMNRLKESGKLGVAATWQLAAAYQLAGKPEVALELTKSAVLTVEPYRELAYTYGSDLRDKAIILEALGLMKDMSRGLVVAKEISNALAKPDGYMSTQEIAYALVAMSRFATANRGEEVSKFGYALASSGEKAVESKAIVVQEKLAVGRAENALVSLSNKGTVPLFVRVLGSGLPRYGTEKDAQNGLRLDMHYEGAEHSSIAQGTDFAVDLTVTNTSGRALQNLALSHLVAAGWEIRNQRVEGGATPGQGAFDYQDIRDDRLYTYFGLKPNEAKTFKVMLNASYTGKFYLPLSAVEAMYDGAISARVKGGWVEVTKAGAEVAEK